MCGRHDLIVSCQALAAKFGLAPQQAGEVGQNWQPRYKIAPGQLNPAVLTADDQEKHLGMMGWGVVPKRCVSKVSKLTQLF